ncbi:shroud [Carabus blaptoides fortunei]
MGANTLLVAFEFVNDVHIAMGSGVLGAAIFLYNKMNTELGRSLCIGGLTAGCLYYAFLSRDKVIVTPEKVVFITGCDSGLGYSMAQHACSLGFTVIAGCLNRNSVGAIQLQKICNKQIVLLQIDITNSESIENAVKFLENYMNEHKYSELFALINNAGILVFGEFEWNTEKQIMKIFDINVIGTMNLTKALLPMLRKYSGRIITISSHCASAALPGLSIYAATKSALQAWSDALRVEQNKYGVSVVKFIPGSFIQQSNLMSNQNQNVYEMQSTMTQEQLQFYGDYFKEYNAYLSTLSGYRKPAKIIDCDLYSIFERTLVDRQPQATYIRETWRYKIFHTLFKITPVSLRDFLVVYFIQMPKWKPKKQHQEVSHVIA